MKNISEVLLGTVTGLLLAGNLQAHDTWILPARSAAEPGQVVSLDLTSGMAFPKNEVGVKPDRLERASIRLAGKTSELVRDAAGKKAMRLKARLTEPGIATAWVESRPRSLELKPAEVREYLDEIGAWDTVGKKWESGGSGRWRESYTKHAKTFVRAGRPQGDDSWGEPVGMALEFVPESDPTALAAGGEFSVRLVKNGRPVPDAAVGLVAANAKSGSLSKTDSEGRVRLKLNRAGWWLIRATVLDPASNNDLDWESHFATLTVHVNAR